ncbi:UDP-glucuronate decarboxylase [Thermolongibacillus altinsuensis]|uniref:UDP-glucuronate decarboxylase n=1 Tax=Thermolongibacillus altinsuensis TaxID=575256 RepID=A0A4R1QEM0_9BACL|nr:NAD-dependent epimerase/dehydratase family protein [Thermolongibacillus altinsuensis]TCL47676.1 UDP-glucuronate decarboxylase [Thermolongibacillus altinsuensis]
MNKVLEQDFLEILPYIDKKALYRSKWLITGATGVIGAYLVAFLSWLNEYEQNNEMEITIVHRSDGIEQHPIIGSLCDRDYISFWKADLSREFIVPNLEKYNYVIHAASNAAPKAYLNDPIGTINANVKATEYFLNGLKNSKQLKCFLYVSSGEIYGEPEIVPTPEEYIGKTNHLHTRSCYVEAKRFAEVLCINYYRQYKIPVKIIRPIHVFGPGFKKDDGRVWADFINNVVNGENIEVLSNGRAERGFCYIAGAITQVFAVIQKGQNGECYNIGSDRLVSIKELAHIISKIGAFVLGKNTQVVIKKQVLPHLLGSPNISCPNIEKVQQLSPTLNIDLQEGITRILKWMLLENQKRRA